MKKKKIFLATILTIGALIFTGCTSSEVKTNKEEEKKVKIMASIYPIAEFSRIIGGDKVVVNTMVPEGAEPHDFEPKAKDMVKLNSSNLFVYNGLQMESWVDKVLNTVESKDLVVLNSSTNAKVIVSEGEEEEHDLEGDEHSHEGHNHGPEDPHIWLGAEEAMKQSELIKDKLVEIDSKNKEYYEKNYENFKNQLLEMKKEYREKFDGVSNKNFVTGHGAFAYLCRDFDLKQKSLEGVFGEGEVTPKQLKDLTNYCKENNVKVVFMPDTASEKLSETLAKEIGAKVVKISSLETNSFNKGYVETMKSNLEIIYENMK